MTTTSKIATGVAVLALGAAPAFAASTPPSNQGTAHKPATTPSNTTNPGTVHRQATPGPSASLPSKAKAYGRFCQGQSKKRSDAAPGTKGTPFSQCVTAMAKAAHTTAPTTTTAQTEQAARSACKSMSKKHVKGQSGTSFSKCVNGAAKLLKTLKSQSQS
jgi:hypothetical protein